MAALDRVVRISVVNGLGSPLNGATVRVHREGLPKAEGTIQGGPFLVQVSGPGRLELEVIYKSKHVKQAIAPDQSSVRIVLTSWVTAARISIAGCIFVVAALIFMLNRGVVTPTTPSVTTAYIGPGPHNKPIAVVFVHGIFGDKTTWASQKTSFPSLLFNDPSFQGKIDVFQFEYYSPRFGPGANVSELAKQLKAALEDNKVLRDHERIVFICHSMGGLITRRTLILLRDVRKVAMIYFYATPTDGAEIAKLAGKISASPQLRSMLPLEGNEALQQIQDDWLNLPELRDLPSFCAYETLPTDGIFVVSEASARGLCNRLPEGLTANHIDIVKPTSRDDPRYTRFATALLDTVFKKIGKTSDGLSSSQGGIEKSQPDAESLLSRIEWEPLRASPPDVTALAVFDHTLFAASKTEVFRSVDLGATWQSLVSFGRRLHQLTSCGSKLAAAEASTPEDRRQEILLSQDGTSWTKTNALPEATPYALACAGDSIVAGDAQGVFASKDGGKLWDKVPIYLAPRMILMHGVNFDAVGNLETASGYCRDTTCKRLVGVATLVSIARTGAGVLYAGSTDGSIEASFNGGLGWKSIMISRGQAIRALVTIGKLVIASGEAGIFFSENEGGTWTPYLKNAPIHVTSLAATGQYLFAGFSGKAEGVSRVKLADASRAR